MKLVGIGPAGEAGYGVELSKQLAHHLGCIIFRAELIEMSKHERQRVIRICNGAL